MDTLPQRVLVYDLKRAIDLIPRDRLAATRVRQLVNDNPRSARSGHVLRNLGIARRETLAFILGEPALRDGHAVARAGRASPRDTDADSSSQQEG